MTKNEYNGWTNYETWCVNLWIDNEESSQRYWAEQADECLRLGFADEVLTREQRATHTLADILRDEHCERFADVSEERIANTVFADLMNAALSEVNWHEIAKHLVDGATERQSIKEGRIYAS